MSKKSNKPISIKFIGMPGAGKTTIAKMFKNEMKETENKTSRVLEDILKYNYIYRHILPFLYIFRSIKSIKKFLTITCLFFKINLWKLERNDIRMYKNIFRIFLIKNFLVHKKETDIYILDESMINSASFIKKENINRVLKKIIHVSTSDSSFTIIVFLEIPLDIVIERTKSDFEKNKRIKLLKKYSNNEIINIYKKMKRNQDKNKEKIIEITKKMNNVFIVDINATKSPEENTRYLVSLVKKQIFGVICK